MYGCQRHLHMEFRALYMTDHVLVVNRTYSWQKNLWINKLGYKNFMAEEKNKKGLGRGLMSLFGDQSSEIEQKQSSDASYLSVSANRLVSSSKSTNSLLNTSVAGESL